jgi:hypothetical protein
MKGFLVSVLTTCLLSFHFGRLSVYVCHKKRTWKRFTGTEAMPFVFRQTHRLIAPLHISTVRTAGMFQIAALGPVPQAG